MATAPTRTLAKIVSHYTKHQGGGIGYAGIKGKGRSRQETGATWNMKRQKLSKRGTTRWDEIAIAKAQ